MSTSPFLYVTLSGVARAPAGTMLIRTGQGSAWVIYSAGAAGTYVGGQLAVLLVPLQPGQSGPVQTSGFIDPDILSLGPGPAGLVYAGPTPSRTGSQVIGTCDSSGLLTLRTAYSTTSVVDTIGGSPWSGTPSLGQVPTFTSNGWTPATPTSGGGAGSTTLLADFTQPAVGSSVGAIVGNTVAFTLFSAISVNGGSYMVTAVADATHCTLLNLGGLFNAAPLATLHAGVVVSPVGGSAPLAPVARGEGQVLMLTGGNDAPTGMRPVVTAKSLSYNGVFFTDSNNNADANGNWNSVQSWLNGGPTLAAPTQAELYFGLNNNAFVSRPFFITSSGLTISDKQLPQQSPHLLNWTISSGAQRYTGPGFVVASGRDPNYHARTLDAGVHTIYTAACDLFAGTLGHYPLICFNDTDAGSINGLGTGSGATAGLTWECFYNPGATPINGSNIFISAGSTPFAAIVTSTGHVQCWLNTTAGFHNFITTTALTLGALQHLVFEWDGQFFTVWMNGVKDATSFNAGSAGNTIVQQFNGDIYLNGGPFGTSLGIQNAGSEVGSIRISNIARYSGSSFTPPVIEHAGDSNTKLLFNFDPAQRSTVDTVLTTTTFPGTTFAPTNGNAVVPTTGTSLVGLVTPGRSNITLGSQSDMPYVIQAVTSSSVTLDRNYLGTTSASTTATATDGHPGWIIAKGWVPSVLVTDRANGAPVWYYWQGIDGQQGVTEIRFKNLGILANGDGIYVAAQQYVKVHDTFIIGHRGVNYQNFGYGGRIDGCYISGTVPGTLAMHSWGIGSANSEFLLIEHNHVFGFAWPYLISSGSGMLLVDNYSDAGSLGTVYAQQMEFLTIIEPHFYLEGANPTDAIVRMGVNTSALVVIGGLVGDGTGAVPIFKINGQNTSIDVQSFVQEDSSQFVFSCPGTTTPHTIKFGGQNAGANTIMDPSNPANFALPESVDGFTTVNVTADADVVLTQKQFAAHTIILTDTGGLWTTARNLIAPFASIGYRRQARNNTGNGHAMTFKTSGGTGPSIADGASQGIGGDGTNWS